MNSDPVPPVPSLSSANADRDALAECALAAIQREYPNHIAHWMGSDQDARPPRELHPSFYGSFDWHSAVHGHWCLARGLALGLEPSLAARAQAALDANLTHESLAAEHRYLGLPERSGFEIPYGLAWLLQLAAELRGHPSPCAFAWHDALRPLETLATRRLLEYAERLERPVRCGEHAQSAFALGLALDATRAGGDLGAAGWLAARARAWFAADRDAPIDYEPSGHDFLSPILAEADLLRRVMEPAEFAPWLDDFLPEPESAGARRWLTVLVPADRADGKLAHLDGLALSRAWMLEGIVAGLPPDDRRVPALSQAAVRHLAAGRAAALGAEHYAGSHWLASFAMYAITRRGIVGASGNSGPGLPSSVHSRP